MRPEAKKRRPNGTTTTAVIASGFPKLLSVDDIDVAGYVMSISAMLWLP